MFADSYVLSGLLSEFKTAFDASWKLMEDVLADEHAIVDCPKCSLREVIAQSYYNGIIANDAIWLHMLKLRNQLSHIS